jgi:hypothetical protein
LKFAFFEASSSRRMQSFAKWRGGFQKNELMVPCMIDDKIKMGNVRIGKLGVYLQAQTESGFDIRFDFVKLPELRTLGVSNITADQRFVLFLDYDKMSPQELNDQLTYLNKEFGIMNFFKLKTGEHRYHVISFEKFHLSDIQKIVDNTLCDYSFKVVAVKSDKGWILRIMPKIDEDGNVVRDRPMYDGFLSFGVPTRSQSRGHIEFFSKLYPQMRDIFSKHPAFGEGYLDNHTFVRVVKYGTSHANILPSIGDTDFVNSKNLQVVWDDGGDVYGE